MVRGRLGLVSWSALITGERASRAMRTSEPPALVGATPGGGHTPSP